MLRFLSLPSRSATGAAILLTALLLNPRPALPTPVTSAGNIPNSGIAPGHVSMATGELTLALPPDIGIDHLTPLIFQRYYASMLGREGFASGHLGNNWLGTYDWLLQNLSGETIYIITNRGQRIEFDRNGSGGYDLVDPLDVNYRLVQANASEWKFVDPAFHCMMQFSSSTGRPTMIQYENGNTLTLSYVGIGAQARVQFIGNNLGNELDFTYYASPFLLKSVTDGTRTVSYAYTGGDLTSYTDASGRVWTYSYAPSPIPGLLSTIVEPMGNAPASYGYDASGRVSTLTDALGHVCQYDYDAPTGSHFSDALGSTWTYQHDLSLRLSQLTDPASGATTYAYDAQGRLTSLIRPMGDPISFTYDPASGYAASVQRGQVTTFDYTSHLHGGTDPDVVFFDLSAVHYPDGTNETYAHNDLGRLTSFQDRAGNSWSWTYDVWGVVLTAANPTPGGTTSYTYDLYERPATQTDNAGNTTHYTYDPLGRLTQIQWPDGPTRSFAYNEVDQLTGLTDERGKIWTRVYDDDHRLISSTDPLVHQTQFVWNGNDQVTSVVDPLGHATLCAYDADGRLSSVTDRTGHVTTLQYDGLHRLTGIVNANSDTWSNSYDGDSRPVSRQDPMGHIVLIGHDFRDNVTHVTDPVSSGFDLVYDPMDRLLSVNGPMGHTESFTYEARGLLSSYAAGASTWSLTRSPLGTVSHAVDPNGNPSDAVTQQGRPFTDTDPLGRTVTYGYDTRGRLNHMDLPVIGSVSVGFDAASNLTDCQWLDGTALSFAYDDAGRATAATGVAFVYDAASRITNSSGLGIGYDFEGRITSETYAAGKTVTYVYDARGLLIRVLDWIGGATTLTYDTAQRLTGMTRPDGTSVAYGYDAAGRLTSAVESKPGPIQISSIIVTRDALGRPASVARLQPTMPAITVPTLQTLGYDAASQVAGLGYDALGRVTSDGLRSFQWDGASRLKLYTAPADSPSFTYDAYDRMISKTLPGSPTEVYVWNYANATPTLDVVAQGAAPRRYFVHTPTGLLLYSVDAVTGARRFYHYDEAGNTIYLTNESGSVIAQYAYTSFGGVTGLGLTADNPFTWGAAEGVIQLGSSGLFARQGAEIYDAVRMRVISGGAISSGARSFAQTNHREDFADAAATYWLDPDPHYSITPGHKSVEDLARIPVHTPEASGKLRDADDRFRTYRPGRPTFGNITFEGAEHPDPHAPWTSEWTWTGQRVAPPRPELAEPCHLCPKGPRPPNKPLFTPITPADFLEFSAPPAPSLGQAMRPPDRFLYEDEPTFRDIISYTGLDWWRTHHHQTYWEEEHGTQLGAIRPANRPGLGDPLKPWNPGGPILIWRFTDPFVGTSPFDTRSPVAYLLPPWDSCDACP